MSSHGGCWVSQFWSAWLCWEVKGCGRVASGLLLSASWVYVCKFRTKTKLSCKQISRDRQLTRFQSVPTFVEYSSAAYKLLCFGPQARTASKLSWIWLPKAPKRFNRRRGGRDVHWSILWSNCPTAGAFKAPDLPIGGSTGTATPSVPALTIATAVCGCLTTSA